jgi:hypothetical protein
MMKKLTKIAFLYIPIFIFILYIAYGFFGYKRIFLSSSDSSCSVTAGISGTEYEQPLITGFPSIPQSPNDYIETFPSDNSANKPTIETIPGSSEQFSNVYTANAITKIDQLYSQNDFGKSLEGNLDKTNKLYDGQKVYRAKQDVGDIVRKGDQIYLDGLHKDHLEVFDERGKFRAVLNLDGTLNQDKTNKAKGRRLSK